MKTVTFKRRLFFKTSMTEDRYKSIIERVAKYRDSNLTPEQWKGCNFRFVMNSLISRLEELSSEDNR